MDENAPLPDAYAHALAAVGAASLAALEALEVVARRLHPPLLPQLRERVAPVRERLARSMEALAAEPVPPGLEPFHEALSRGAAAALEAVARFTEPEGPGGPAAGVLASLRAHCRAQEAFYPLRFALPALGRTFAEPEWHARLAELDPEPPADAVVGLLRAGAEGDPDARGGFALYVPERYRPERAWPLVVALHGGFGHGGDFLWTWLREARSRGFLLLAPTSAASTWALDRPAEESRSLAAMVELVAGRWNVDRSRVLLTGLSDGATFALLAGLAEGAPYTALAPVSGVLHPQSFALGNLGRARGRRIYLVHGALDWLFPVALARAARDALAGAGADVTYREIADLSHAYPREENAAILSWFDPDYFAPSSVSTSRSSRR